MMNSPIDVIPANLKIVPYYTMKNPSEPSLMISAMSCMPLGPTSFFKISHKMVKLTTMKHRDTTKAEKQIMAEV
jgi:hypothetical protein